MKKTEIKNVIVICAVIFILMLFETSAIPVIRIKGVRPDLLFSFVLFYACIAKNYKSVTVMSLIVGILSDFLCHFSFVGFTAPYILGGVLCHYLKNIFIRPNIAFDSVIALLIFIAGKIMLYPAFAMGYPINFAEYFLKSTIPEAFFNTLCFFVMMVIYMISKGLGGKKNVTII